MKLNTNHVIIMAGGIGSRFWPMSTPESPNSLLRYLGCGFGEYGVYRVVRAGYAYPEDGRPELDRFSGSVRRG